MKKRIGPKEEVLWCLKKTTVLEISKRFKKTYNQDHPLEEYAVIAVGGLDDFDELYGVTPTGRTRRKVNCLSLLCFEPSIYDNLVLGAQYRFEGKISFGYGSKYLKIKKAKDSLGFPVGEGQSIGESQKEE